MEKDQEKMASENHGDAATCGPSPGPGCSTFSDWLECIPMYSVHPDSATRGDVAMMASHIMELRHELCRLQDLVGGVDNAIIQQVLYRSNPSHHDGADPAHGVDGVVGRPNDLTKNGQ